MCLHRDLKEIGVGGTQGGQGRKDVWRGLCQEVRGCAKVGNRGEVQRGRCRAIARQGSKVHEQVKLTMAFSK